ncbi:MAG: hypothetical protein MUE44_14580 [Oscillatoriaceae cyanobacterium Prado104]|jgi:hypothetical protein|nr:hypothetical protein [Oscillatoriaceae cyanobacterium Prado104]
MLTAVIIINLLISLVCFYIAVKMRQFRREIVLFEKRIAALDRCCSYVLSQSPAFFGQRQQGARQLRGKYRQLAQQLEQVQQLLGLLGWGRRLWLRRDRP